MLERENEIFRKKNQLVRVSFDQKRPPSMTEELRRTSYNIKLQNQKLERFLGVPVRNIPVMPNDWLTLEMGKGLP